MQKAFGQYEFKLVRIHKVYCRCEVSVTPVCHVLPCCWMHVPKVSFQPKCLQNFASLVTKIRGVWTTVSQNKKQVISAKLVDMTKNIRKQLVCCLFHWELSGFIFFIFIYFFLFRFSSSSSREKWNPCDLSLAISAVSAALNDQTNWTTIQGASSNTKRPTLMWQIRRQRQLQHVHIHLM